MPAMTWRDLGPDPNVLAALEYAGAENSRETIRAEVDRIRELPTERDRQRERSVLRDMRKRWSERFATACATMIANEIRRHPAIRGRYSVLPDEHGGGQETFTPLGYKKGKRVDVVVSGPLVGLQIGVSLKGLNFADDASGSHDKNLTGRLYELRDEVSTVHDYLPRAFMGVVFFLPVGGCLDKTTAPSSLAHLVGELRARTGRLDASVGAHAWRCDYAAVGLYVPGDPIDAGQGLAAGAARYFPLLDAAGRDNWPPERGLPRLETTFSLAELTKQLIRSAVEGTVGSLLYAPAEGEALPPSTVPQDDAVLDDGTDSYDAEEDDELDEEGLELDS